MRIALLTLAYMLGATAEAAPGPSLKPVAPVVRAGLIPLESFADTPFLDAPVISPDGKRFAARTRIDGKSRVMVYSTLPNASPHLIELGKAELTEITWAGNGRLLLRVATRATVYGGAVPVLRLVAVDLTTDTSSMLDQGSKGLFAGDVLYVDPGGGWILVASQNDVYSYPSVKRIDLATGVVTPVEKARDSVWNWFADGSGTVRAGIAYSGDRWTMWYRADPASPLERIRGRTNPSGEDGVVEGVKFLSEPGKGVILTNSRTGRFAVYRYDFRTGQIGDALYENPDVDITGIRVASATGEVEGVAYTDDRYRIAWLDPQVAQIQLILDKALPAAENIVLSASSDNNRMIVWSGAANDPGTYYLFDRSAHQLRPIATPFAALDGVKLSPVKPIRYAARDGLSIPGYLTLPRDKPDRALPLIVMPHGGPYTRDNWDYDPWVQFLASRGYAVLQPNFRGSTGYGKDYVERGYGQWGRAMQDDVDDGVTWLIKSGTIDPKRVCIMGASYGGYAALWGATRNPDLYRCAVSFAGVSDVPGMLRYDKRIFAANRYYRAWERKVRGLEKLDLAAVSPLMQAKRLNIPVFIAHGEDDTTVPVSQSRALVSALQQRKAPVESVFYAGEGHGLTKREDNIDFLKRLEMFLAKNNPA